MITERHPFEPFIPERMKFLILGSFPGKEQTQSDALHEQWFYGAPRNLFWKIMEGVYDTELKTRTQKENLFTALKIGMTDIIFKAERSLNSNLDGNLSVIEWNDKVIAKILEKHIGLQVFCTSRFVEKCFRRFFPDHKNVVVLPSPSPRFARMNLREKTEVYKQMLPKKRK